MNAELWVDGIRIECTECGGEGTVEAMGPVSVSMISPPYRYETCEPCDGKGWVFSEHCENCTANGYDDVLVAGICHERALCIECIVEARLSKGPDAGEQILAECEPELAKWIRLLQQVAKKPGMKRVEPAAASLRREARGA